MAAGWRIISTRALLYCLYCHDYFAFVRDTNAAVAAVLEWGRLKMDCEEYRRNTLAHVE